MWYFFANSDAILTFLECRESINKYLFVSQIFPALSFILSSIALNGMFQNHSGTDKETKDKMFTA